MHQRKGQVYPRSRTTADLCVAALGDAPGVYTADWAERQTFEGGPGRDWYMAMGKVEGKLVEQGPDTDRSAYFICTSRIGVAGRTGRSI